MLKELYTAYIHFFYNHIHRGVLFFIGYLWINKIGYKLSWSMATELAGISECLYYWTIYFSVGAFVQLYMDSLDQSEPEK